MQNVTKLLIRDSKQHKANILCPSCNRKLLLDHIFKNKVLKALPLKSGTEGQLPSWVLFNIVQNILANAMNRKEIWWGCSLC